jgi:hypothetical protein
VVQRGQVSAEGGAAGVAPGAVVMAGCAAVPGAGPSGLAAKAAGAPMRIPQTSQKSSVADWWPDGHVAIAIPS